MYLMNLLSKILIAVPDYSDARAVERINSDLVNSVGNLLSRTTALSVNKQQDFPPLEQESVLVQFLSEEDVKMYHSLQNLPGMYFAPFKIFHEKELFFFGPVSG